MAMATPWDADTYDVTSAPQQSWATDVLTRLDGIPPDATVLDVGCGTGRVTELLPPLVPHGRVVAIDASADMVAAARERLGDRAEIFCQDVLELEVSEPVDVVVSTAALHWVTDHERMWGRLARALRSGGKLEIQCGGAGNIARVRAAVDAVAIDDYPELVGWSPWEFATPQITEHRLVNSGFTSIQCWLTERPDLPGGRNRVRPHLDPHRAPESPATGPPHGVRRRGDVPGTAAVGLRPAQRVRGARRVATPTSHGRFRP